MSLDLRDAEFLSCDTETTGTGKSDRIIELGAVRFRLSSRKVKVFNQLINPEIPIGRGAINVHGIHDSDVAGKPRAAEILPGFLEWMDGVDIVIAHNAQFDCGMLSKELQWAGVEMSQVPFIDTLTLARNVRPGLPSYSLTSLVDTFSLPRVKAHRAMGDALTLARLFRELLLNAPEIKTVADLAERAAVYTLATADKRVEMTRLTSSLFVVDGGKGERKYDLGPCECQGAIKTIHRPPDTVLASPDEMSHEPEEFAIS